MQVLRGRTPVDSTTSGATTGADSTTSGATTGAAAVQPDLARHDIAVTFPARGLIAQAIAVAAVAAVGAGKLPEAERPSVSLAPPSAEAFTDPLLSQTRRAIDGLLDGDITSLKALKDLITRASPAAKAELSSYMGSIMEGIKLGETPDTVRFLVAAAVQDLIEAKIGPSSPDAGHQSMTLKWRRFLAVDAVSDPQNWEIKTIAGLDRFARGIQILGELDSLGQKFDERKMLSHLRSLAGKFSRAEIGEYAAEELKQLRAIQARLRDSLNDYLVAHIRGEDTSTTMSFGNPSSDSKRALENLKPHLKIGEGGAVRIGSSSAGIWKLEPLTNLSDPLSLLTLRHEGSSAYVTMPIQELAALTTNPTELNARLKGVIAQNEMRSTPDARKPLRSMDLPEGCTAFITVLPDRYDRVVSSQFVPSALLEATLIDKYGAACPPSLLLTEDPLPALRIAIQAAKEKNPTMTDVFVQLHNHGSPSAIEFGSRVTGADLAALAQEFPGVKFHVMSIACFGGGVAPELERLAKDDPRHGKELNFYSHTSSDLVAIVGGRPDPDDGVLNGNIASTPYFYELIFGLIKNPRSSLGEVLDVADNSSQSVFAINPESFVDGVRVKALGNQLFGR